MPLGRLLSIVFQQFDNTLGQGRWKSAPAAISNPEVIIHIVVVASVIGSHSFGKPKPMSYSTQSQLALLRITFVQTLIYNIGIDQKTLLIRRYSYVLRMLVVWLVD